MAQPSNVMVGTPAAESEAVSEVGDVDEFTTRVKTAVKNNLEQYGGVYQYFEAVLPTPKERKDPHTKNM